MPSSKAFALKFLYVVMPPVPPTPCSRLEQCERSRRLRNCRHPLLLDVMRCRGPECTFRKMGYVELASLAHAMLHRTHLVENARTQAVEDNMLRFLVESYRGLEIERKIVDDEFVLGIEFQELIVVN